MKEIVTERMCSNEYSRTTTESVVNTSLQSFSFQQNKATNVFNSNEENINNIDTSSQVVNTHAQEENKIEKYEVITTTTGEQETIDNNEIDIQSSIFLTETESDDVEPKSRAMNKRHRNRTIDYHSLPSLYWEASVQNYHEKKYVETGNVSHEVQTENDEDSNLNLAKDGLSIILQK